MQRLRKPLQLQLHTLNLGECSRGAIAALQYATPVVLFVLMNWIFWALLSALFAGLTAILAKIGVKGIDSNLATAIRTTVILVFAWSVALMTQTQKLNSISKRTLLFLVLSGLATGASWLCYFKALQLGDASKVAPVDKLSVVVAIALAALFLHEPLTWHHCEKMPVIQSSFSLTVLRPWLAYES